MTLRERFNKLMSFKPVDRLPYVEFRDVSWPYRLRWIDQGAPVVANPYEHFGFDEATNDRATSWTDGGRGLEHIEIDLNALPRFDPQPVRTEGDYHFTLDVRTGVSLKRLKARTKSDLSVKTTADPPVKTRADWAEYKKRFDPFTLERYPRLKQYTHHLTVYPLNYPETWTQAVKDMAVAPHIVTLCLHTGFNFVSNAVGFERLFKLLVDEPKWVHEMIDHFGGFVRKALQKALVTARIDYVSLDDDTPPRTVHGELLISPAMFMDYTGDHYRETLQRVAECGIQWVQVPLTRNRMFDDRIVQMVIEAGLTPILPADAEGEFGVTERRRQYGGKFPLWGGMDADILCRGKPAIDRMIENVFAEAPAGGYFPTLCDRYGKFLEVPFENYRYYTQVYRKANGME